MPDFSLPLSEPIPQAATPPLPTGWDWADWPNQDESKVYWKELDGRSRAALTVRFREITANIGSNRLPKEKYYVTEGVGKAKIRKPSPGQRAWVFRDGDTHYLAFIVPKDDDHDRQKERCKAAKAAHLAKKQVTK